MTKRTEKETINKNAKSKRPAKPRKPEAVVLPAVLGIGESAELLAMLTPPVVDGKGDMEIDASEVERITTPAIQILLSAARTMEMSERRMQFKSPSETLLGAFRCLGLESEITTRSAA